MDRLDPFAMSSLAQSGLAARGATPSAFERRCIPPPPQRGSRVGGPGPGCVAPPSNIPDILGRRALPAGRLAALGATPPFMRWVLVSALEPAASECYTHRMESARDD